MTGASNVTVQLEGDATASATTSVNGHYAFTGLARGTYTVTPAKSGHQFYPALEPRQTDSIGTPSRASGRRA